MDCKMDYKMDCMYKPEQYKMIYITSYLAVGSSIYAVYNGHYLISLCPAGIFLTSINHWRKPKLYSWQRCLDLTYVNLSLIYQLYKAYRSQYMMQYYVLTFLAISFYPLGNFYYNKKLYWHSAYAHCILHIIANIANIFLYSGQIE